MKLEFDLAKTLLLQKKKRQIQTLRLKTAVFGIFLACFGLFLGASLIVGYHKTFVRAILAFSAHITVKPVEGYLNAFDATDLETILNAEARALPLDYSRFLLWEGLIPTEEGFQAVAIKGVEFAKLKTIYEFVYEEDPVLATPDAPSVYLGKNLLLQKPKIAMGRLPILFLRDQKLTQDFFAVKGSFQSGIEPYDSEFVFMDLKVLYDRIVQHSEEPVLGFEIRLKNFSDIETLTRHLRAQLGGDYQVIPWDEVNFSLLDGLKLEKTTFACIGFCILLVAALNIFGFNLMFFLQNKESFRILLLLGYAARRLRFLLRSISLALAVGSALLAAVGAWIVTVILNAGDGLTLEWAGWPEIQVLAEWNWGFVAAFFLGACALSVFTSEMAARSILRGKK